MKTKPYSSTFNAKRAAAKAGLASGQFTITPAPEGGVVLTILPPPPVAVEAPKARGARATVNPASLALADQGILPTPPDFTAPTHAAHRKRLAEMVAAIEARDIAALQAVVNNPASSSRKAMESYRTLALRALTAMVAK